MSRLLFAWGQSRNQLRPKRDWPEIGQIIGLFLAALVLCLVNLNTTPLLPDEQIVLDSILSFGGDFKPEIQYSLSSWQEINFNTVKSQFFIYLTNYPWLLRLPSALLTSLSIPLLYRLGRESFKLHLPALFSAIIYLTYLPVISYGRLGTAYGLILFLEIAIFWCGLRVRRDLRWALVLGLSVGILMLIHSWLWLPIILVLTGFWLWDTPRLITSPYLWLGAFLGCFPAFMRYGMGGLATGEWVNLTHLIGLWENHQLILINFSVTNPLKFIFLALPWLIFAVDGFNLAWRERLWSWAKFLLVGTIIFIPLAFVLNFNDFKELLLIYPIFSLAGGIALAKTHYPTLNSSYPKVWGVALLSLMFLWFIGGLSLYFNLFPLFPSLAVLAANNQFILLVGAMMITLTTSSVLIWRGNPQFITILAWGMYVSLILWLSSPYWLLIL